LKKVRRPALDAGMGAFFLLLTGGFRMSVRS
jgi:hypothetical protein